VMMGMFACLMTGSFVAGAASIALWALDTGPFVQAFVSFAAFFFGGMCAMIWANQGRT
jgi:hypothetical protein